jgi:hypothetical protein
MITKKILPALLITAVLAASVSTSASARDRGGNGFAIAAGVIGAVALGSIIANAAAPSYYPPQPVYQPAPQPVYYQAPQPVYYQAPQQVYYQQPAPVYVRPAPVYVERREYRDVYYNRY